MTGIPLRSCRVCGCTDARACWDWETGPCHWVAADLCSACSFGGPAAAPGHGPDDDWDSPIAAGLAGPDDAFEGWES
jgi:cytochrome c5